MITSRAWFIISGAAALLAFNSAAVALQYQLSSPRIQPGERAVLEVRLKVDEPTKEDGLEPPEMKDDWLTQSSHFQLLDRDVRRDGDEWVWHYEITAHRPGKITIPPVEIRHGPQNYSTEATSLEIVSSRAEKDDELRPEFGEVSPRWPWGSWFKALTLFLAVGVTAWYIAEKWKPKQLSARPTPQARPPEETPRAWLQRQMAILKMRVEAESDKAAIIDDLTRVVREYYSRKSSLPVQSWTSRELKAGLATDPSAQEIHPVFVRCDVFRFSGQDASEAKPLAVAALAESEKILLCGT